MYYSNDLTSLFFGIKEFDVYIRYTETEKKFHIKDIDLHSHSEFEIYINLSGDVSFLVENNLFPLTRGDIIIARPGEMHHCIYRSEAPHKLYWILCDCEKNPFLFEYFLKETNTSYISPEEDVKEEIIKLCENLIKTDNSERGRCFDFLRMLSLLEKSDRKKSQKMPAMPGQFMDMLCFIDEHVSEPISLTRLANIFYLSESTIERRFKEQLDMSPGDFIRKKKLALAAEYLRSGASVSVAGMNVGYTDISHFIKIFKENYKVTPFQYRRSFFKKK